MYGSGAGSGATITASSERFAASGSVRPRLSVRANDVRRGATVTTFATSPLARDGGRIVTSSPHTHVRRLPNSSAGNVAPSAVST